MEHFLDDGYNNEAVVCKYRQRVIALSPIRTIASQAEGTFDEMREEAADSKWAFLSGAAGQKVILAYSKMLTNFADADTPWRG